MSRSSGTRGPVRLALGAGSLPAYLGYTGVAAFAVPVYQMTLGVDPVLLGAALALPRLWEAFADPVMGQISDNCRWQWGRRRPFVVMGAAGMGVAYGLIWMVSPHWSQTMKLGYFAGMSALFFTAYTVFSVPYASLTYEAAADHDERTRVMASCAFFHKTGEFGYQWLFPITQLALFGSTLAGVRWVGWTMGLVVLAGIGVVPGLFVRERFAGVAERQPRVRLWASAAAALRSRSFLIVAAVALVNIGMGMLASNLDYYTLVYYVFHGDITTGSVWKGALSSAYAGIGIIAIPAVVRLADGIGKRDALVACYTITIVGGVLKWFWFTPRHPWLALLDPVLCAPIWVAANLLLASMLADICDEDELVSGQRREGMFGAVFSWLQKTAVSFSLLGTGLALAFAGFQQRLGGGQTGATFTIMRASLAGSTALPPILAIVLLRRYRLDAGQAAKTRRALEELRAAAWTRR